MNLRAPIGVSKERPFWFSHNIIQSWIESDELGVAELHHLKHFLHSFPIRRILKLRMCWTQSRRPWLVAVGLLLHYFSVSTCSVQHFLIWYDSTKTCVNHSSPGTFWNFNESSAVFIPGVLSQFPTIVHIVLVHWNWTPLHISLRCQLPTGTFLKICVKFLFSKFWSEREREGGWKRSFTLQMRSNFLRKLRISSRSLFSSASCICFFCKDLSLFVFSQCLLVTLFSFFRYRPNNHFHIRV